MKIFKKIFGRSEKPIKEINSTESKPKYLLGFEIESIDDGSSELNEALPIRATIIERLGSPDGGEYFLAKLEEQVQSRGRDITYLIVGGRLVGCGISPEMKDLPINIALVTNNDLISEDTMNFDMAEFSAIGTATALCNK